MVKNELDKTFARLKKQQKKALIAYLAAGYPSFSEQRKMIQQMIEKGMDILELGVPFSDPIADGPTIQFASQESLRKGTTLKNILEWISGLKQEIPVPIVLMSYLNPILHYGLSEFALFASKAGVSGIIVPDLIPEESGDLRKALANKNIHLIHLVAPTTPVLRQNMIARLSKGFLYAVSVTGVTGARTRLPLQTVKWLAKLRKKSPLPVCVGFGISGPKQIKFLKKGVDGFIVGSALIDIIRKHKGQQRLNIMRKFIGILSKECH